MGGYTNKPSNRAVEGISLWEWAKGYTDSIIVCSVRLTFLQLVRHSTAAFLPVVITFVRLLFIYCTGLVL